MKKKFAIALGVVLIGCSVWAFIGASAWAEVTSLSQKFYECASVVLFWGALFPLHYAGKEDGKVD